MVGRNDVESVLGEFVAATPVFEWRWTAPENYVELDQRPKSSKADICSLGMVLAMRFSVCCVVGFACCAKLIIRYAQDLGRL